MSVPSSSGAAAAPRKFRRQQFLSSYKTSGPKPANAEAKQQDVAAVFQKLIDAGSYGNTYLSIFTNEDYVCLKPLVFKLFFSTG